MKLTRRILLACLAVVISLGVAETALRKLYPARVTRLKLNQYVQSERGLFARYDAQLGWTGLENIDSRFRWVDVEHSVEHNRFGYRGSEIEQERGVKRRFLFLGDSFVWGFGVGENELFTRVLERLSGNAVEVMNMGVSGYGTDQSYLLWRHRGHLWKPDDVVLGVTLANDLWDNAEAERYGCPKPVFEVTTQGTLVLTNVPPPRKAAAWRGDRLDTGRIPGVARWLSRSVLASMLVDAAVRVDGIRHWLESRQWIVPETLGTDREYLLYLPDTAAGPELEAGWRVTLALIEAMREDVQRTGARLHVMAIPSALQVYPGLRARYCRRVGIPKPDTLDWDKPNKRLAAFCAQLGIDIIDLTPVLRAAGRRETFLYYPVNNHWTPTAHALVAGHLFRAFRLSTPAPVQRQDL